MECRRVEPIVPLDVSLTISPQHKERLEAIQSAIRHAWNGYSSTILLKQKRWETFFGILPPDDLAPLSKKGFRWLHSAATLFDSLDTLYIAGLTKEYEDAVDQALALPLPFMPVKTFEYSIRVLGGLLGAYSVSGDVRTLQRSRQIADSLLDGPFRSSPTALPRMYDVLSPSSTSDVSFWNWGGWILQNWYTQIYRIIRDYMGEHVYNSLAGVGTFSLEFSFLTKLSNRLKYEEASNQIYRHIIMNSNYKQTVTPMLWNVMTGSPATIHSGLGSGSDSYYEYLLKTVILLQDEQPITGLQQSMLQSYQTVIQNSLLSNGLFTDKHENNRKTYPVENGHHYQHLLCFVPGMLALGHTFNTQKAVGNVDAMRLAINMTEGCWHTYQNSKTGLGPESFFFSDDSRHHSDDSGYFLRPELVESIFILYRVTNDTRYQDLAWKIFQSIESNCKLPDSGGYASLLDVSSAQKKDEMPSFFLAETLKYLFLTFAPRDYISLDDFVFTTEAHPLRRISTIKERDCTATKSLLPVAPILSWTANLLLVCALYRVITWCRKMKRSNSNDSKKIL